jgi:hypothetical protein
MRYIFIRAKLVGCSPHKKQRLQRSYDETKAKMDDLELGTGLAILLLVIQSWMDPGKT